MQKLHNFKIVLSFIFSMKTTDFRNLCDLEDRELPLQPPHPGPHRRQLRLELVSVSELEKSIQFIIYQYILATKDVCHYIYIYYNCQNKF